MRKLASLVGAALLAPIVIVAVGSNVAQAQCPGNDGTVPGTPARVTAVGPIYVDDRDFADADDDGDAGGLWLYLESNNQAGLQRGGDQVWFAVIAGVANPNLPYIPPTQVVPPNPATPNGLTLFPSGFGGGSLSETAGGHDDCVQSSTPDTILF
jgi:hypothetical protein